MSIVDRYVARMFISSFLVLLAVGVGLYILGDLLVNLDEFTSDRNVPFVESLRNMADYYGHNLPLYFAQLGAPVLAFAAAFTLALMLRSNEMTVLVAAGMRLQRLIIPLMLCAAVVIGLLAINRELVLPAFATKIARTRDDVIGTRSDGVYCVRDDHDAILTALRLHARSGVLGHVYIIEPDETGRPAHLIEADTATWIPDRQTWKLTGPGGPGRRLIMGGIGGPGLGEAIRSEPVAEYPFTLSPDQLVLRQGAEWAEFLSTRQLMTLLESRKLPNRPTILSSLHTRLTHPVLQLLLLLLTVPAFLSRVPSNVLACGARSLVVTGLFFGTTVLAGSIIREEHAALVAWVPIFLFTPVAVIMLANVKT